MVLTDAVVVIDAHENNYWEPLCAHHRILLSATVIEDELRFFRTEKGTKKGFKIADWIKQGKVERIEADLEDYISLQKKLKPDFLNSLHRGELEALAILMSKRKDVLFTTADRAAHKALGVLNLGHQSVSVEELMLTSGHTLPGKKKISHHFTRKWMLQNISEGFREQDLWLAQGLEYALSSTKS